nr:unnamed protein product [Callosobruchus chinensis]
MEGVLEGLRSTEEVPEPYQRIFAEYPCFNMVQSKVLDNMLKTDESVVVSAPTGSGKTAIFELAIVRLLTNYQNMEAVDQNFKIIYICPIKALCQERLIDWHSKFSNFGLKCTAITGDSTEVDFSSITNHHLIISTPEKWDSLSRKWRDHEKIVRHIRLFMIDEVHLLHEDNRGSTLEVIVCRMKTVDQEKTKIEQDTRQGIRFVAVSATIPNVEDIARWICKNPNLNYFKFSEEMRPVKLNKIVLGYSYNPKTMTPFKFDLSLNYKLKNLIMQYSEGKPTLIFCSTRKSVEMTALHLIQGIKFELSAKQMQKICEIVQIIGDEKIKSSVKCGIGYHHAGLSTETRHCLEDAFRSGNLPILVTTSTLSMGVNLPAHLVIVKSTKCYDKGGFQDYSQTAIQQMIGRAGRPQYDVTGTALILTTLLDKSNLHRHLIEHLNAEVVLGTITDLDVAMQWIASTYLYVRAVKNPRHYGLPFGLTKQQIDKKLLEIFQIDLNKLVSSGMLCMDHNIMITPTVTGQLMARYYIAFETMKLFTQLSGTESLIQILALISKCREFSDVRLRTSDKKTLNLLNKCSNKNTIRFPLNGRIKTGEMKLNCIIQAVLGNLEIPDHAIQTESYNIMRNGLIEYLDTRGKNCYNALLNAIILGKCFNAKLWEDSPYVTKQLTGIGNVLSTLLANAGKTSFEKILQSNPRDLELIIRKKPPAGDVLYEQVQHIPKYELKLEKFFENEGSCRLELTVNLLNLKNIQENCTVNINSVMHSYLMENISVIRYINIDDSTDLEEVHAHFISEDWVGFDCHRVNYFKPKQQASKDEISPQKKNPTYMQMFLDMYMKIKKPKLATIKNKNEAEVNKEATKKGIVQKRDDKVQLPKHTEATPKKPTKNISPSKATSKVSKKSPNKTPEKNQGTIRQWFKNVKEAGDDVPDSSNSPKVVDARINKEKQKDGQYSLENPEKQHINNKASKVDNSPSKGELPSSTYSPNEQNIDKEIAEHEGTSTSSTSAVYVDQTKKSVNTKKETADKGLCTTLDLDSLCHPSLLSVQRKYTQSTTTSVDSSKPSCSTKLPAGSIKGFAIKRKLNKPTKTVTKEDQRKRIRLDEYKLRDKEKISHLANNEEINNNTYAITEILEPKMQANPNKYTFCEKNKENNNNNQQKNISWRSPLVFSPATKFSPKIAYHKMSPRENFRFESPTETPSKTGKQTNVPNLILNIVKTPKGKQKPDYNPFPLRDKDYEKEDQPEKEAEDDMDYSDIYSSPTLDRIRSAKKYKQCEPKSAMEYFSHFEQSGTSEKQAEVSKADSTQKQDHQDSVKEDLERSKESFKTFEFEERLSSPESTLTQRMRNDFGPQNRQYANNLTIPNSQEYLEPVTVYADNPTKYIQSSQKFYPPAQHTITSQIRNPCSGCLNPQCSGSMYRRAEYQASQIMNMSQPLPPQVTNPRIQYIPRPILSSCYNHRAEPIPQLRMSTPNPPMYYPQHSHYFAPKIPLPYQPVRHSYPEQFPTNEVLNETFAHEQASDIGGYPDFGYSHRTNTQELSHDKPQSFCDEEQKSYHEEPLNNTLKSKLNIQTQSNDFVEDRSFYLPEPEMYNPRFRSQLMQQPTFKAPVRAPRSSEELGFPRSVSQCFEDRHMPVDHRFVQSGRQASPMPVMMPNYPPFYNQNMVRPGYVPEAYARGMMEQPVMEYQPYMSPRRYGQPLPSQAGNDKEYVMNKYFNSFQQDF